MLSRVLVLVVVFSAVAASAAQAQSPCADVPKDEPFVMVTAPAAGAKVTSGFAVAGCSRTFESTVAWTLTVRGGKELARGTATGGGVDGAGPLSFRVAAKVDKPTLAYLEVVEPSASGKGGNARVIVPVVLTH
ncbi:MAG: Gmad2 immunoglobulin-like domain-containing protein [Vicinamibacterales bacterium]